MTVSLRILNDIRLDGSESFSELLETEFGVAVEIKPTHDRCQFLLDGLVAYALEEASYRGLVNHLVILIVNGLEGPPDAETLESLQVLLELLEAQLKVNLLGQQNCEFFLNHGVKVIVAACAARRSLRHVCAQVNVRAR